MQSQTGWNILIYANDDGCHAGGLIRQALVALLDACLPVGYHVAVQLNTKAAAERFFLPSKDRSVAILPPMATDNPASLTEFIDDATKQLRARATMLVLCAHGEGIDEIRAFLTSDKRKRGTAPVLLRQLLGRVTFGWGPDPSSGLFLTNADIQGAIARSLIGRVDVLAINACWMGMFEIAYQMRDVAATIVVSQVFSEVWPYRELIEGLELGMSAEQVAGGIVACVRQDITAKRRDDAICALRGWALRNIFEAIDDYAEAMIPLIQSQWPVLNSVVQSSLRGVEDPYAADLTLMSLAAACGDWDAMAAASEIVGALDLARIDHAADPGHPGVTGLSLFFPPTTDVNLDVAYGELDFKASRWATFLQAFLNRLRVDESATAPVAPAPHPPGNGVAQAEAQPPSPPA